MISLDKRLSAIAKLIDACGTVADIGCDHGKLSVWLLQNSVAAYVFAVDISRPSLQKTADLAALCGVSERLTALCGDGLTVLPQKVDIAVIAGVGGKKIVEILSDPRRNDGTRDFVLQPMRNTKELLEWLDGKYEITANLSVEDRKKYDIIKCSKMKESKNSD